MEPNVATANPEDLANGIVVNPAQMLEICCNLVSSMNEELTNKKSTTIDDSFLTDLNALIKNGQEGFMQNCLDMLLDDDKEGSGEGEGDLSSLSSSSSEKITPTPLELLVDNSSIKTKLRLIGEVFKQENKTLKSAKQNLLNKKKPLMVLLLILQTYGKFFAMGNIVLKQFFTIYDMRSIVTGEVSQVNFVKKKSDIDQIKGALQATILEEQAKYFNCVGEEDRNKALPNLLEKISHTI